MFMKVRRFSSTFLNYDQEGVDVLAMTSDNRYIISGSYDKSIKIFDFENKCQVFHLEKAHEAAISSIALTSDNRYLILGSSLGSIKVLDLQTKQEVHHFQNVHKSQEIYLL